MTMAVLEANGKPIPAAPNPQPAPLSEIPTHLYLSFPGENHHVDAQFECVKILVH